jgi:hypothetical protein
MTHPRPGDESRQLVDGHARSRHWADIMNSAIWNLTSHDARVS